MYAHILMHLDGIPEEATNSCYTARNIVSSQIQGDILLQRVLLHGLEECVSVRNPDP